MNAVERRVCVQYLNSSTLWPRRLAVPEVRAAGRGRAGGGKNGASSPFPPPSAAFAKHVGRTSTGMLCIFTRFDLELQPEFMLRSVSFSQAAGNIARCPWCNCRIIDTTAATKVEKKARVATNLMCTKTHDTKINISAVSILRFCVFAV